MYTVPGFKAQYLSGLAEAGLDEIRFHIPQSQWKQKSGKHLEFIKKAILTEPEMDVGVELPALPGEYDSLVNVSQKLDELGAAFLNLNELEFSETNWQQLRKQGYDVRDDVSAGVAGSEKLAQKLVKFAERSKFNMSVHYCSASFKDRIQLRNRLLRRAENTKKPFDIVTEEGMFIRGVIESKTPIKLKGELQKHYKIPGKLIEYDREKHRIQLAAWILEDLVEELSEECYIVEEYPTADRLEVERRKIE
jgi:pyruvate formate-lyase activating enzyme-like uncharacterized protein